MHILEMARRQGYAVAVAFDLLGSAILGGAPWQTISARLGKAREQGSRIWTPVADALDWLVVKVFRAPNHCTASLLAYEERASAVD